MFLFQKKKLLFRLALSPRFKAFRLLKSKFFILNATNINAKVTRVLYSTENEPTERSISRKEVKNSFDDFLVERFGENEDKGDHLLKKTMTNLKLYNQNINASSNFLDSKEKSIVRKELSPTITARILIDTLHLSHSSTRVGEISFYREKLFQIVSESKSLDPTMTYCAEVFYEMIESDKEIGSVVQIINGYLSMDQRKSVLVQIARMKHWRRRNVLGVLVQVMSAWSIKDQRTVLKELPMIPIKKDEPIETISNSSLWSPKEIGNLISKIMRDQEETNIITALLIQLFKFDLATPERISLGSSCYMALVREIVSASLSGDQNIKNWEDVEVGWVIKNVCSELGYWAFEKWGDFKQESYMIFLADLICQVSIRRNLLPHDYKLVQELMEVTTYTWPRDMTDELAEMIERRFRAKNRTFWKRSFEKTLDFFQLFPDRERPRDDLFPIEDSKPHKRFD